MDSKLDPIFKTRFLQTEPLDTRQAIRRHDDPAYSGGRHHKSWKEEEQDLWEDQTTVSVQSLKQFLAQLIAPATNAGGDDQQPAPAPGARERLDNGDTTPETRKAAQAARAYERTYRATHKNEAAASLPAQALPAITLSPEEIRIIHKLIDDLEALSGRKVETLIILKSESFLQSLVEAVRRHKQRSD